MAAGDGLVTIKPTSINYTGTSATINDNGSVSFTSVSALSFNNIFTVEHTNYLIVGSITDGMMYARLRTAGSDASGTDYTYQVYNIYNGSVSASRSSSADLWNNFFDSNGSSDPSAYEIYIFAPYLGQATGYINFGSRQDSGARIRNFCGTHSVATSYDGISLLTASSSSGTITVFGYEE